MLKKIGCLILTVTSLGLASAPAKAAEGYGAIAIDNTATVYGVAVGLPTRAEAEAAAESKCEQLASSCTAQAWFANGYISVASGINGDGLTLITYGISPNSSEEAQEIALGACQGGGFSGCSIQVNY